jgi:hypothetical protein
MKRIIFLLFLPLINLYAQWDFSLAMGIDYKSSPAYRDYVNYNFAPVNNKLKSFNTSINFSGEVGYQTGKKFQLGFEYSLAIDSYSTLMSTGGVYDISYTMHRPSLIGYYFLAGEGYKLKFGGGIGVRIASLNETIITKTNFSANGFGLLFRADANTLLSGNFYVLIGLDLRYDITDELSSDTGNKIINFTNSENVDLNSISVGLKVGITYIL